MTTKNSPLVGVFNERAQAEAAIEQLHNAGIPDNQISYSGSRSTGGFLADIKSLFTGEDATSANLVNDLTSMGLSRDEARYYENEYRAGRFIVAVNPTGRRQDAQSILNGSGAYSYTNTGYNADAYTQPDGYAQTSNASYDTANTGYSAQPYDYTQSGANGTAYDTTRSADYADTTEDQRLRLREERLNVDKQPVQTGEARLRKDVVEEQQNIDVPVNHEEVFVQRRSYGEERPSDLPVGQDETIRIPVSEEQVNVQKQTVETGEVGIGKRSFQDQRRVSDTVRREEARLEREGDPKVRDVSTDQDNY